MNEVFGLGDYVGIVRGQIEEARHLQVCADQNYKKLQTAMLHGERTGDPILDFTILSGGLGDGSEKRYRSLDTLIKRYIRYPILALYTSSPRHLSGGVKEATIQMGLVSGPVVWDIQSLEARIPISSGLADFNPTSSPLYDGSPSPLKRGHIVLKKDQLAYFDLGSKGKPDDPELMIVYHKFILHELKPRTSKWAVYKAYMEKRGFKNHKDHFGLCTHKDHFAT